MPGKLTVVMGPMFAGKTTELQRRIKREIHACRRVCIIKYGKDERYSKEHLSTHDQSHIRPTFSVEKLSAVGDAWEDYDVVAIDEGQFFPDLVEFVATASDAGKTVIVSALDGDFLRRPFGKVCDLIPLAEEVVKITAVCMACHEKDASFTRRTVDSTATELIGGADMYIAVCRDCYNCDHPPTPGRMSRYKQSVKEVERMCLRGVRTSADIHADGTAAGGAAAALPAAAAASGAAPVKEAGLRRARDENSCPGGSQPNFAASGNGSVCGVIVSGGSDEHSNPPIASPSIRAPAPPLVDAQ